MLRFLLSLVGLYLLAACSSQPTQQPKSPPIKDTQQLNDITLSHVRAYLLIGNVAKAEERFQTINHPEFSPDVLLTLAELRAAKGDDLGAQQAFLQSINHAERGKQLVSTDLLDYFCRENKWEVLKGYASGLVKSDLLASIKNQQLSDIGLCFYRAQHWQEAYDWLIQLDFNQAVQPVSYLALARLSLEQKNNDVTQQLINKFEANKTQVDPEILWTSFEIYSALQQPQLAQQAAQQLLDLFPNTSFTRKYLILTKRKKHAPEVEKQQPVITNKRPDKPQFHLIKKGETLYQLSKRYNISVADLLKLNPNVVVDDISLGTPIQVSE